MSDAVVRRLLSEQGEAAAGRHRVLQVDLSDAGAVEAAVRLTEKYLVVHLGAESHIYRSIAALGVFIESNFTGIYNRCRKCGATSRP